MAAYAVVNRWHDVQSQHSTLDEAILACVTRREIAHAGGSMAFGGYAVHNVENYDGDSSHGLTDAEAAIVSQALSEAGVF